LKVTPVNWERLKPVIVTTVPAGPSEGQIEETDGPMSSAAVLSARAVPRTET
jgi:hypothetical protein